MRNALAVSIAAAGIAAVASAASAQECVNGYRTIGTETIVKCSGGAMESFPEAPATTGSIAPRAPAPESESSMMVDSPDECRPGAYWMMEKRDVGSLDVETPMACPR